MVDSSRPTEWMVTASRPFQAIRGGGGTFQPPLAKKHGLLDPSIKPIATQKEPRKGGGAKKRRLAGGGEVPLDSRKALIFHSFCCNVVCQNGRCILLFDAIDMEGLQTQTVGPGCKQAV